MLYDNPKILINIFVTATVAIIVLLFGIQYTLNQILLILREIREHQKDEKFEKLNARRGKARE